MLSPSQRQENDDLIHCLVISAPHHSRNDGASNRLSILKSPSHKTHLPKTCPKIRKKHMTSTMSGSTHQISPKKRFRNTFLEFSWGSHHQKTPNLSQFPTTSSIGPNVTTSQCLRFPTTLNRMRKKRGGSQRFTMEIAWNTCWFSGLLGILKSNFIILISTWLV